MKMKRTSIFSRSEKPPDSSQLGNEQIEPGCTPALPNDNDEATNVVDDSPPDGGYGWVVQTLACYVLLFLPANHGC